MQAGPKFFPSGQWTCDLPPTMKALLIFLFRELFPDCESTCNFTTVIIKVFLKIFGLLLDSEQRKMLLLLLPYIFIVRQQSAYASPWIIQFLGLLHTFYPLLSLSLMHAHSCDQRRASLRSAAMHQTQQRADLSHFQKESLIQPS